MLRSILCDYSDAYILVKGPITVANTAAVQAADNAAADNADKKVIFKICMSFTGWISRVNYTQIDDAQHNDVVMPMYNLIEHSHNYLRTSGIFW